MKEPKLKTCPFCGRTPRVVEWGLEREHYRVTCDCCEQSGVFYTMEEAVAKWNQRCNESPEMIKTEYLKPMPMHKLAEMLAQCICERCEIYTANKGKCPESQCWIMDIKRALKQKTKEHKRRLK